MREDGPSEAELDTLEAHALAAWRTEDDDERELPGGVEEGFAERVMSVESSILPISVLAAIDDAPPPPAFTSPRARRWPWALGAAAIACTVLAVVWGRVPDSAITRDAMADAPAAAHAIDDELPSAPPPIPDNLGDQIASYLHDYGRHFGPTFEFHGAILVARAGEVHFAEGFGVADPTLDLLNDADTRFRIGMLTEHFTAAAILQLRDAGMLDLDDPVAKHIPGYPNGRKITIEQLLDHTSGIPNYTDLPGFHRWKQLPHRTDELIGRFSELPLEFAPGSDFNPTNSGYFLLGAIIERLSGMSYADYMQQYVFRPAGMSRTQFGDAPVGAQARGHVWNEEEELDPPDPIDMSVFGGAGGLISTPTDLARWERALADNTVLSRSSVEQMLDGNRYGYGFGWLLGEAFGQPVASFPGAIDGFNGAIMRFADDRTLIVVLCNTEVVPAARVAQDVAMMVFGEAPPPRIEYPEVQVAPGTFARYLGTYGITDDTIAVHGTDVDTQRQFDPLATVYVKQIGERLYFDVPGHGSTWMHPMGKHRFFFKDNSGNYLRFVVDKDGRPEALVVHYADAELELQRKGE